MVGGGGRGRSDNNKEEIRGRQIKKYRFSDGGGGGGDQAIIKKK